MIIGPANEEAAKSLLNCSLPPGLTIKTIDSSRNRFSSPNIVIKGVPASLDDAALTEATGFPCHRLLSAANNGRPTSLIKMTINNEETKKNILQNGILLGHQRFKAMLYNGDSTTLLCFKCFGIGHIAKNCKEAERKCRRCGEGHLAAECKAAAAKCINCGEQHEASNPSCPTILAHKEEKKAKTMTTAAKSRQPADNIEALRLAACIASCFKSFATKAQLSIQQADINNFVAKSVREAYKVSLTAPHVKSLRLANEAPSDAQL